MSSTSSSSASETEFSSDEEKLGLSPFMFKPTQSEKEADVILQTMEDEAVAKIITISGIIILTVRFSLSNF